jgi:pepF/M3 family oligoendopeptidase
MDEFMNPTETWNLESIFPGGSRSTDFADFLAQLAADFERAEAAALPAPLTPATELAWLTAIETLYGLGQRLHQAGAFVECLVAQNVHDDPAMQLEATIGQLSGRLGTLWTNLSAAMSRQDDTAWARLLNQPMLKPVAFHLNEERDEARQKMPPEMEALVNELAVDGYHAWDRLYGLTSGTKQVEFAGQPLSLGQLQSKMYDDPDPAVRRDAFNLFESAWTDIAKPCAAALNNQAGFRLTLYKHRGWDSVLKEPLQNNRLSAQTLETMWAVVDAKNSKLLDYFAAKARLLGIDQLGWTDVHAPLGQTSRTFTYAEAAAFVVDHLRRFNPDMGDFAQMAVDQRWVEAEDRPGKRAGGFCTGFPLSQQSRIFMTFTGSFDGLLTLAHELGHAYHSWVMRDLPPGAQRYAMSVAETASTFAEEVVRDAALQSAAGPAEKLSLFSAKLNDAASFLMDIRSRYGFETAFFRERAKKTLSVDELSALMLDAQQHAFKNGLTRYHPLFWASKLHFYITAAPFYNFPYTFGYLFSSGVYAQALAEGPAFKERYIALLRDTGRMTTEELARVHLGVDLTRPDFWEAAVDRVLANVDEFTALAASNQ